MPRLRPTARLFVLVGVVAYLLVGCDPTAVQPTPSASVTGVVIAVDGPNTASVETFRIQANGGQTVDFRVGRLELFNGGLPAPHLREHLVSGIPIAVDYYVEAGTNVAVRYVDAE